MSFKTSDLAGKADDIIAEAMRGPVMLTSRNKPRLVLMNVEEYQRLRAGQNPRNAYTLNTAPAEMLDDLERGLNEYLENGSPA